VRDAASVLPVENELLEDGVPFEREPVTVGAVGPFLATFNQRQR
jgi:hypothetical protein